MTFSSLVLRSTGGGRLAGIMDSQGAECHRDEVHIAVTFRIALALASLRRTGRGNVFIVRFDAAGTRRKNFFERNGTQLFIGL